eukprot:g2936.t1
MASLSVPDGDQSTNVANEDVNSNDTVAALQAKGKRVKPKTEGTSILLITVSDPVKMGDGMNAYITYKINTKTDSSNNFDTTFTVVRRYSDFVWLRGELVREFPGAIIPALPDKSMLGRFTATFVENRRRALEKCLNRIAKHALLSGSDHFKVFLEANEESFAAQKSAAAQEVKSNSKGIFGWLQSSAQVTYAKVTGANASREKTEADRRFDALQEYVGSLETQLTQVATHTSGMIRRSQELGQALFDFGLAFVQVGKTEEKAGAGGGSGSVGGGGLSLSEGLTALGHTADSLSVATAETAEKEALFFLEQIKDYLRTLGALKEAMSCRERAQQDLWQKEAARTSKEQQHRSLAGTPGKEEKALKMSQETTRAAKEERDAKEHLDIVERRLFAEFEALKKSKLEDFKAMMLDFVQLQVDYNKKVEKIWSDVIPTLEKITFDESASSSSPSTPPPQGDDGDAI